MKLYPSSTLQQLEFDKIQNLLAGHCRTSYARNRAEKLRIHTKLEWIVTELNQTDEYLQVINSGYTLPNNFTTDIRQVLKLLSVPGATLSEEQFMDVLELADNTQSIMRWFNDERKKVYPALYHVQTGVTYEMKVEELIKSVLDESGSVKDDASEELASIRMQIFRKRNELRKLFAHISSKYAKQGYLADIEESFMNGRRVLAVVAEYKRMVNGVLHGESDSRRTAFIEPEETTHLNNELFSLAWDERKEIQKLLRTLTAKLSVYAPQLVTWLKLGGEYDFIFAKAKFAQQYDGAKPVVQDKAILDLRNAKHPLLLLKNKEVGKPTIPLDISLDQHQRILVISGPNAGGKTVTMKTIGLSQLMLQSGLLVSASADSVMGVFKQIFIHIGDTQSIEFELSTYSSQLKNMKHFTEQANGKTLFFIDELGSGSDPTLGGAFAEVFLEAFARKHAFGVVTTHYLNLKIMANSVSGIINGAMQFDEKLLQPLYRLQIGQPGSSYTFAIAERIGIDKELIAQARKLVEKDHVRLDKLLNKTEQDLQKIDKEKDKLNKLVNENARLKAEMEKIISREAHKQEIEKLKHQNYHNAERLAYLKDMERKLKAMVVEFRRAEDKTQAVKMIAALLFGQKEKIVTGKKEKEMNARFKEVEGNLETGMLVKLKKSKVIGTVTELRGKKAIVQVGLMPLTVDAKDLALVIDRDKPDTH